MSERALKGKSTSIERNRITGKPIKRVTITYESTHNFVPPTLIDVTTGEEVPLLTKRPANAQHPSGVDHLPDVNVRED